MANGQLPRPDFGVVWPTDRNGGVVYRHNEAARIALEELIDLYAHNNYPQCNRAYPRGPAHTGGPTGMGAVKKDTDRHITVTFMMGGQAPSIRHIPVPAETNLQPPVQ